MTNKMDSAYAQDGRVRFPGDGTAIIPASAGFESEGDWAVEPADGGFTVRNTGDQGYVTDPGDRYNQRRELFATVDGGIYHVIGDPQR